ncbi:hypothetical protein QJS10_CPA05g01887 [Acorus calamus]|uniref:Calmodulin-binding protein n=1 Tax=Acorus calamus TaxID=4465 RepID=A0AAV9EX19_ACOCL|nr:hypothetical protein QJS10_CPA05g01887 [Acorus calamus]
MNALQKLIEPLLRTVVKEEVELALTKHLAIIKRQCGNSQIHPSASCLQLQFTNRLSLPIFTGTRIEGDNSINIALVDALTGQVIMSGPESLMKVEIVVLEGDFEGDEEENWTYEEFENNIVKEREGKPPLLSGDVFLNLNEGIGTFGELMFTDNSSWTRSRKFRLGARVGSGHSTGMRVREAKTKPFIVKDHRGELYKKHHPPSLDDEVWRLEKIGKDGAFHKRLCSENIKTVKDFLILLNIDSSRLRNILGSGMSAKMWEVVIDHARTCSPDNLMYFYGANPDRKSGVFFDTVGQVMGMLSEEHYIPDDELSKSQKADALMLVKSAFDHWVDVVPCENTSTAGVSPHFSSNLCSSGSPLVENFESSFSSYNKSDGFGLPNSITSPSYFSPAIFTGDSRFDLAQDFLDQDFYGSKSTNISFETDSES